VSKTEPDLHKSQSGVDDTKSKKQDAQLTGQVLQEVEEGSKYEPVEQFLQP
jgi:hypothetical protein